jgi:hypothetical protein
MCKILDKIRIRISFETMPIYNTDWGHFQRQQEVRSSLLTIFLWACLFKHEQALVGSPLFQYSHYPGLQKVSVLMKIMQ